MANEASPPDQAPVAERGSVIRPWAVLAWLPAALVAAVLALYRLGERPITYDESVSLRLATIEWDRFRERVIEGDQLFGALYYGLLRAWTTFGVEAHVIRLPSAMLAVATVPLAYLVARRLFGGRVAAAVALLLAVNPFFIRHAQDARAYALVLFLVTLSTYLLLRALERPTTARWLAYGLSAAVAAFAHLFAAFALLVHLATMARHRLPLHAWLVVAAAAAAILPFAALIVLEGPQRSFIPPITLTRVRIAVDSLAGGSGLWPPVHGIVYGGLGGLALLLRRPRAPVLFCAAWLAIPILLAAVISLAKPILVSRYLVVVIPAFVMLVAAGAEAIRPRWAQAPVFMLLLALSVRGLVSWYLEGVRT